MTVSTCRYYFLPVLLWCLLHEKVYCREWAGVLVILVRRLLSKHGRYLRCSALTTLLVDTRNGSSAFQSHSYWVVNELLKSSLEKENP